MALVQYRPCWEPSLSLSLFGTPIVTHVVHFSQRNYEKGGAARPWDGFKYIYTVPQVLHTHDRFHYYYSHFQWTAMMYDGMARSCCNKTRSHLVHYLYWVFNLPIGFESLYSFVFLSFFLFFFPCIMLWTGLPKYPRRALHPSCLEARFGGVHFFGPPRFSPLMIFFGFFC